MIFSNPTYLYAGVLIRELVSSGVDTFIISPGHRSAPLVGALSYFELENKLQLISAIDERAAGFMALGYGKEKGHPAALICTSGTALANYLPAVIEAHHQKVPLLILSADRPPELYQSGANQTINQLGIFSTFIRHTAALSGPGQPLKNVARKMSQALNYSIFPTPGPCHINIPLNEPLFPKKAPLDKQTSSFAQKLIQSKKPITPYYSAIPESTLPLPLQQKVLSLLKHSSRPLFILGEIPPIRAKNLFDLLKQFIEQELPLFCDISSSLKNQFPNSLGEEQAINLRPDTIIHLGGRLVGKALLQGLAQNPPSTYIQCDPHSHQQDPHDLVTLKLQYPEEAFLRSLEAFEVKKIIKKGILKKQDLNKTPSIPQIIWETLPEETPLFIGNSSSIRLFDNTWPSLKQNKWIPHHANRGTSGIEGLLSTAKGLALAHRGLVVAFLGDISLIHDLNSLHQLEDFPYPIIIIVLNNKGGEIFRHLPIKDYPKVLDPFISTPHNLSIERLGEAFNLPYQRSNTVEDFSKILQRIFSLGQKKSSIIELTF